ncbi:acylphosphatase [Rhodosalinus sp. 5P4]|uniref:acylphosphatase n=1 Tax=Rhodosalinus sp. 5P4 TaxID=3239196 RepID=UPI0035256CE4
MAEKAIAARVEGRVQGVSFRAWTQEQARSRGLAGWVRNRSDGSVEALIQGPDDAVSSLLERLREGPPAARVTQVSEEETAADPALRDFEIRR